MNWVKLHWLQGTHTLINPYTPNLAWHRCNNDNAPMDQAWGGALRWSMAPKGTVHTKEMQPPRYLVYTHITRVVVADVVDPGVSGTDIAAVVIGTVGGIGGQTADDEPESSCGAGWLELAIRFMSPGSLRTVSMTQISI